MTFYYACDDGDIRGPASAAELTALHASGVLHGDSPVIAKGEPAWSCYRDKVEQLAEAGRSALPPPIPAGRALQGAGRPLSPAAARVAQEVKQEQGEFDDAASVEFPALVSRQNGMGKGFPTGDPSAPDGWVASIRLFVKDKAAAAQLYVMTSNNVKHGVVEYNRAALPGGSALELTYISHERRHREGESWVVEHLGVGLPRTALWDALDSDLRVQISRPDKGLKFVVSLPAHYVEAVLYRMEPEKFDAHDVKAEEADRYEGLRKEMEQDNLRKLF